MASKDAFWACCLEIRNTQRGRNFASQWFSNCEKEEMKVIHDQGILTLTAYEKSDGMMFMDVDDFIKVAKNVHLHPVDEFKSLILDIVSNESIRWFMVAEWGYNSQLIRFVRSLT